MSTAIAITLPAAAVPRWAEGARDQGLPPRRKALVEAAAAAGGARSVLQTASVRATSTGRGALLATKNEMEPTSIRPRAPRPWEPRTRRVGLSSACHSSSSAPTPRLFSSSTAVMKVKAGVRPSCTASASEASPSGAPRLCGGSVEDGAFDKLGRRQLRRKWHNSSRASERQSRSEGRLTLLRLATQAGGSGELKGSATVREMACDNDSRDQIRNLR